VTHLTFEPAFFVTCDLCHHEAVLPADEWSDAVLVSAAAYGVQPSAGIVGTGAAKLARAQSVR